MMNKTLTSREAILSVGKEIVTQAGVQALNMREVAQRCGVSVGSVYNYFPSKNDLVIATVESVWTEMMHGSNGCTAQTDFAQCVASLFETVQTGSKDYPSFFSVHFLSLAAEGKSKGRAVMGRYFGHIKSGLLAALRQDTMVRAGAFSARFTEELFVDFVFINLLALLLKENASCDCLLEIVKRTIY